jgi:dienelactone hydrolase
VPRKDVTFSADGKTEIKGWLYGSGTTAFVASHQVRQSKTDWNTSAPWLAAKGYMFLAFTHEDYDPGAWGRDLDKLSNELLAGIKFVKEQGAKKIILIGASMGGAVVMRTAAKTEIAGYITLSGSYDHYDFDPEAASTKATLNSPAGKLFVNTEGDAGAASTKQAYDEAKEPKELKIYSGGTHGVRMFDTDFRQDLIDRILAFAGKYAPLGS